MSHPETSDTLSPFSVIIPTLNGAEQLEELLSSFRIQTVRPREVLVIDSSSSDDTVQVAKRYGAQVLVIDRDDFDHGGTRTMAARRTQAEYLVFFTQDVLPAHRSVLENLIQPLIADSTIGVSYGRQLPCFDASEIARHLRLFNYPAKSQLRDFADRSHLGLSTVFASNSCAAYNKKLLSDVGHLRRAQKLRFLDVDHRTGSRHGLHQICLARQKRGQLNDVTHCRSRCCLFGRVHVRNHRYFVLCFYRSENL